MSTFLVLNSLHDPRQVTQNHPFQLLDDILAVQSVNCLSLNPHSSLTTSFVELGNLVAQTTCESHLVKSLRDTLERVLYALLQNFPDNIFWDFDFIVSSMLKQALAEEGLWDSLVRVR